MPAIEARPRGRGKNPKESGGDGVSEVLRRLTDDACEVALFSRVIDGTILGRV